MLTELHIYKFSCDRCNRQVMETREDSDRSIPRGWENKHVGLEWFMFCDLCVSENKHE